MDHLELLRRLAKLDDRKAAQLLCRLAGSMLPFRDGNDRTTKDWLELLERDLEEFEGKG